MPPQVDMLLAALSDRTRRAVFEKLREGPRAVADIAAGLPVSRPAVSQHLKVLKASGLVRSHARGRRVFYSIDARGLGELRGYLDSFWDDALAAFAAHVDAADKPAVHRKTGRR
jgi:DNA-binding transcriptional ArsR family regulator